MENNNKPKNTLGAKIGQIFGVIISACLASLVIALTVKIIVLMF